MHNIAEKIICKNYKCQYLPVKHTHSLRCPPSSMKHRTSQCIKGFSPKLEDKSQPIKDFSMQKRIVD